MPNASRTINGLPIYWTDESWVSIRASALRYCLAPFWFGPDADWQVSEPSLA
jgi:hypothetical protein